jgi:hypothetical protein
MGFFVLSLVLTQIARRMGWALSLRILYIAPPPIYVFACIAWGAGVAVGVFAAAQSMGPHWLVKWIFGYAQGAYAADVNHGLFSESTIPESVAERHQLISVLPIVIYAVALIGLELFL